MKNKNILLVNDNSSEVEHIQKILDQINGNVSLTSVSSGKDALHILMGSSDQTKQIRPDIILLNKNLPDMTGVEFLGIMRKYYSLENIKIFLLTDSVEEADLALTEKLSIAGFLAGPYENNPHAIENFKSLRAELAGSHASAFSFFHLKANFKNGPGLVKKSLLKGKMMLLQAGYSAALKTAACITGVLIFSGATIYSANSESKHSQKDPDKIVVNVAQPEISLAKEIIEAEPDIIPQAEKKVIVPVKLKVVHAKPASPFVDTTANRIAEEPKHFIKKSRIYTIKVIKDTAAQN